VARDRELLISCLNFGDRAAALRADEQLREGVRTNGRTFHLQQKCYAELSQGSVTNREVLEAIPPFEFYKVVFGQATESTPQELLIHKWDDKVCTHGDWTDNCRGFFLSVDPETIDVDLLEFAQSGEIPDDPLLLSQMVFVVNFSHMLLLSARTVIRKEIPISRQQRRDAERRGRLPRAEYEIVLRPGKTVYDLGKAIKRQASANPLYHKRRHLCREYIRVQSGKLVVVREHQRGGKAGLGPHYNARPLCAALHETNAAS